MRSPSRTLRALLAATVAASTLLVIARPVVQAAPAQITRLSSLDRYGTAAAVSAWAFPSGARRVFIASGTSFPDALAAAPVATSASAPILLTARDVLPIPTILELRRLDPDEIVILGGTAAVSDAVARAAGEVVGSTTRRIAGSDRYATAAALAASGFTSPAPTVYVATGEGFPDALAGAAAAAGEGAPILLVRPSSVPIATHIELARLHPGRIVVLGGTTAVSDAVALALAQHSPTIERIAGNDRFDTAAKLATATHDTSDVVFVATGLDFPDAVTGGVAAGLHGSPLLLVGRDAVGASTAEAARRLDPAQVVALGGAGAVTDRALAIVAGVITPVGDLKPVIAGVVQRDGIPPRSVVPVVNGAVVKVTWAELQPTPGAPLAEGNPIDAALATARSLNAADPELDFALKLRVLAGVGAPEWAKSLDGPPITIVNPEDGITGTTGRFWTPAFGAAYDDLQQKLAARYDEAPEVREVAITRCTTVYGEPLLRQMDAPETPRALVDAGYTLADDATCQRAAVATHDVWRRTRSSLALNPYQAIQPDATVRIELDFTVAMMDHCRALLGARCVLGNNSIRTTPQGRNYPPMYDAIRERGAPIYFQTMPMEAVGDLKGALDWAASQGAAMVELPWGYLGMAEALLRDADDRLEANAR